MGGLIPITEAWQPQPEVYENNTYSLDVTFCGFKPDLHPGSWLRLGTQDLAWETTVHPSRDGPLLSLLLARMWNRHALLVISA